MKILHIHNVAHVAWYLARAQESLGHEAKVLIWGKTADRLRGDVVLPTHGGPLSWNLEMFRHRKLFQDADVIHVHGGIRRLTLAYRLFRSLFLEKVFVVHLHGSETRMGYGLYHLGLADAIVCATPDLRDYVPQAQWIPNPHPVPDEIVPPRLKGKVIIGHFPTKRSLKGTTEVLQGFRDFTSGGDMKVIQEGGLTKLITSNAELWIVEGIPYDYAMNLMRQCDIVVDQIMPFGIYSLVSVEGMSLGKVVVCSYKEEYYGKLPIVPVGPYNDFGEVLRNLFSRREEWHQIGLEGSKYVRRKHDAPTVAGHFLRLYHSLLSSRKQDSI